jgi:hypothetical protein
MIKKIIGGVVGLGLFLGLVVFIYLLTNNKLSIGYNKGYEPTQPIPFSHKLHAGQYGIDCKYCHTSVEVSKHSSVPSMNICMNCHLSVGVTKDWIQKLQKQYAEKDPIAWQKVHLLPDHVKFNHAAHIKAGKDCNTCHGPIEQMEVVYQWSDLSMGWCINCHRGDYDETLSSEDLKKLKDDGHTQAPINCSTCHY